MAKKQTRKSLSINRKNYDQLKERCDSLGVSMASVLDGLVRAWLSNPVHHDMLTSPRMAYDNLRAYQPEADANGEMIVRPTMVFRPAVPPEVVARQQAAARVARIEADRQRAEQIEKERQEREDRAYANPCRRENCRISILHEAHE